MSTNKSFGPGRAGIELVAYNILEVTVYNDGVFKK